MTDTATTVASPERRQDRWGVLGLVSLTTRHARVRSEDDHSVFSIPKALWEALPHVG